MAADLVNLSTESYKEFESDEVVGKKGMDWFLNYALPKVRFKSNPHVILLMCVTTPHLQSNMPRRCSGTLQQCVAATGHKLA